jgi:hypothetical protein
MKNKGISLKRNFPIDGLKWIPYLIGWILGVFFTPFWIILLIVGVLSKDKHEFIDVSLHNTVYIWGIFCIGFILFMMIFASIFMAIAASSLASI